MVQTSWLRYLNRQLAFSTLAPDQVSSYISNPGRWAMEVAEEFPACQVIGIDLSPIETPRPLNCEFIVGDLTQELVRLEAGSMDFVHSRYLRQQMAN
jgi:hypothetical protein